ncbi:metallophosphoesterase domain-containing protein 1 [Laetiporus sulphureus 93-53]|uniref:Metallophosphoesterase domain-containing protein 1 n=1 Tax=Laetiporus sulphureus 93-53 TaxID=1314785 RepID=A0A165D699_9APHY|nr:metallophosphoesterase domain-containing protein 1 [Laetiporus sulphureus 93-53]KZT04229.1 metallophosphoesterase domain-containing protein 1 [Laetiporus sulphureus 93-53]
MSLDALLRRRRRTFWEDFISSPLVFFARYLYRLFEQSAAESLLSNALDSDSIRVVCISDTHNAHNELPPLDKGDVLIHAGDLTNSGTLEEIRAALGWLNAQTHLHKVFIAGNHDTILADLDSNQRSTLLAQFHGLVYLQDSSTTVNVRGRELVIYGSPQTPRHGSWQFQYPRVHPLEADSSPVWSDIPPIVDVLVTHGPPAQHLDNEGAGCAALLHAVWRTRPALHVFGHIHGARGVERVRWTQVQEVYERISAGLGGWWDLVVMIGEMLRNRIWMMNGREGNGTILVNASALGGLRDEKRRGAIVVDI